MPFYPVNLDVRGLRCVVIGGGVVASRKIDALLPCEARIRVISPVVCPHIAQLSAAGLLDWQQRDYKSGDLDAAKLVFAATNDAVIQKKIVSHAAEAGILVNVIDMPEACSFQVPASFRRGELLLTVATGGGSPALAARICRELQKSYGQEYEVLVALMAALRKKIVSSSCNSAEHKQVFEKLLDSDILVCIRQQRWNDLSDVLQDILPPAIDVCSLLEEIQICVNGESD